MLSCALHVQYAVNGNSARCFGTIRCHNKFCPICAWRTSAKWSTVIPIAIENMARDYEYIKPYFLTLTLPNCPASRVANHLRIMSKAWKRLLCRAFFKTNLISFVRSVEFTHNKTENDTHPHYHIILLAARDLEEAYRAAFPDSKHDLKTFLAKEWGSALADELKKDISVDAQDLQELPAFEKGENPAETARKNEDLLGKIRYLSKYVVKSKEISQHSEWAAVLMNNTQRARMTVIGHTLNRYMPKTGKTELQPDEVLVSGLAVNIKRSLHRNTTSIVSQNNAVFTTDCEETAKQKQTGQSYHQALKNGWVRYFYEQTDFAPTAWLETLDYVMATKDAMPEHGHLSGHIIADWLDTGFFQTPEQFDRLAEFLNNLADFMTETGLKSWEVVGLPHPELPEVDGQMYNDLKQAFSGFVATAIDAEQADLLATVRNQFDEIQYRYNAEQRAGYFPGTLTRREVMEELRQTDLAILRRTDDLTRGGLSQGEEDEAKHNLRSLKYKRNAFIQKLTGLARSNTRERFQAVAVLHQAPYTCLNDALLPVGQLFVYELEDLPPEEEPITASLARKVAFPFLPHKDGRHDFARCFGNQTATEQDMEKADADAEHIAFSARTKANKWNRIAYGTSALTIRDDATDRGGLVPTSCHPAEAELAFFGIRHTATFEEVASALLDEQAIRSKVGNIREAVFNERNAQRIAKGLQPDAEPEKGFCPPTPENMRDAIFQFTSNQAFILNASRSLRKQSYTATVTGVDNATPFTGWSYEKATGAGFKAWRASKGQRFDSAWFATRAVQITVQIEVDGKTTYQRFYVPRSMRQGWEALKGRTLNKGDLLEKKPPTTG
ncbi:MULTISPECIES: protein rep [unclassified Rhodanobacter]|uniref:Protein rep n=1 Tax=Rhodanobacter humi TaxID=1888173 RepID=A0ABV4ALH6_9GAMM